MVARPFRPVSGPYTASGVLAELARLWDRARAAGARVSQAELARESGVATTTLSDWAAGKALPREAWDLSKVGAVLARWAGQHEVPLAVWESCLEADQAVREPGEPGPGRLIAGLDPFVLEVHRPVVADTGAGDLPVLPRYVRRAHDEDLAGVAARAAAGHSGMAVLVGGSSTGKTRACWEAVHQLPAGWRLWHPFDPTRPEAALADLARVGPRTVVWLNETQLYLDTPGDAGERVAAALRTLLTDPGRAPVLILGTLWPQHWDTLTQSRGTRPQACTVLDGTDIAVPAAFTGPALADLRRAAGGDPRLAAAAGAPDGQVTQYLAGVPELMARYRNAPPAARALIHAAMDARRLGHSLALPHALLEAAAPAYLTGTEWDTAGEDWLEQALAWTAAPCKGVSGPLTRIRPRPPGGPAYRLADYLDQHGRRHRATQFPPDGFWRAAGHCLPAVQAALGNAARDRGLYRHAAQLYKNATAHGHAHAASRLVQLMHGLHPADHRAAQFAAVGVSLDDPVGVASLLGMLGAAGAGEQARALGARAAAGVSFGNPYAVASLLASLGAVGAGEQARALLARDPAAGVSLDDPYGVARLLGSLGAAGAGEQARALGARAAAGVSLDDPAAVASLLGSLGAVGAGEQARALGARAATGVSLDDPAAVASLLGSLGAGEQARALGARAATGVSLDDPAAVASLLGSLGAVGAGEQARALGARAAAGVPLDDPVGVADLLASLGAVGAGEQARALLARDPAAGVSLDDPVCVASLLGMLGEAGAGEQARALGARAAAGVSFGNPYGVASLLASLGAVGAGEQARALLARDPAAGVSLDDPYGVAMLLDSLREAGAGEQARALGARAAAGVSFDYPYALASLLASLRAAGAGEQARALLARDPAAGVSLDDPYGVAMLLDSLREAGAGEQARALGTRAAAGVSLDDPDAVARLLGRLRKAGAEEQVTSLIARLPAAGMFDLFQLAASSPFRFGYKPDASPAASWGWEDLY